MLVYNDIITGDQLLSDSYVQEPLEYPAGSGNIVEGVFLVRSQMATKAGVVLSGANPSAEDAPAGDDGDDPPVNNMIDAELGFGYVEGAKMSGKEFFAGVFKPWAGAVKKQFTEKGEPPKPFMKSVKGAMDFIKKEYKNCEIWHGDGKNAARNDKENFDSFILGWWDDKANETGCQAFVFFKHALVEEKY